MVLQWYHKESFMFRNFFGTEILPFIRLRRFRLLHFFVYTQPIIVYFLFKKNVSSIFYFIFSVSNFIRYCSSILFRKYFVTDGLYNYVYAHVCIHIYLHCCKYYFSQLFISSAWEFKMYIYKHAAPRIV